jgi:putative DNA primase/helicase
MSAIESALSYAERGWPVLPITPREKRPLTRNGVKDASCDAGVIHSWFDQWPDANLAVAMGRPSGVFVVDLDAVLWPEEFGPKPEGTLRTLTGKGEHVWFTQPDDVEPGNRVGVMPNVDVRSTSWCRRPRTPMAPRITSLPLTHSWPCRPRR